MVSRQPDLVAGTSIDGMTRTRHSCIVMQTCAHGGTPARLAQHCAAVRAAEAGNERGSSRWPDLCVSAKGGEQRREGRRVGVLKVERLQDEPVWC